MKKFRGLLAVSVASLLALTACGSGDTTDNASDAASSGIETIRVGASPVPHAEILEFIDEELAEEAGIEIVIEEYDDYQIPNRVLDEGDLDANYFQHLPFLEEQIDTQGYELSHGEAIHIEPYAAFSENIDDLDEVEEGDTIGITNDASNQWRALKILEEAGLLEDLEEDSAAATLTDEQNPLNLKFEESPAEFLVQTLDDPQITLAIINGNYFVDADLDVDDAIAIEPVEDNPYGNILVWRTDNETEGIKKLEELLHSDEVKDFIEETWPEGELIPAF